MYLKFKNKKDKNLQYNRRETKTRYLNNCLFDVVVGFFLYNNYNSNSSR